MFSTEAKEKAQGTKFLGRISVYGTDPGPWNGVRPRLLEVSPNLWVRYLQNLEDTDYPGAEKQVIGCFQKVLDIFPSGWNAWAHVGHQYPMMKTGFHLLHDNASCLSCGFWGIEFDDGAPVSASEKSSLSTLRVRSSMIKLSYKTQG